MKALVNESVKILICLCSLNAQKVYIPGETHIAIELKKSAFDLGFYFTIQRVHESTQDQSLKDLIDLKFFSLLELSDYDYMIKLLADPTQLCSALDIASEQHKLTQRVTEIKQ